MRRKKRFALIYGMIIWSAVMVCDETNGAGGVELSAILPFGALGWMSDGDDGSYDADTLFEYINGGAEVYRSFNVKRVFARRYVKDGSEDIITDVFEMNSKDDAFGVFSHDIREGEKAGIGDDSEYTDGMLAFRKGSFFVSIAAMEETESSKKAVFEIGRAVEKALPPSDDALPDLVRYLADEKNGPYRLHYFHNHQCLNAYYFLSQDNLLGLGTHTDGALGLYRQNSPSGEPADTTAVVLIRYPSENEARAARDGFVEAYMPEAKENGVVLTENGRWTLVERVDRFLIGIFDAPSERSGRERLQAIAGSLSER